MKDTSFRLLNYNKIQEQLKCKYKYNISSRVYNTGIEILKEHGYAQAYYYFSKHINNMSRLTLVHEFDNVIKTLLQDLQFM